MLILALDTSTPVGSVALLSNETVLSRASAEVKGRHGELLIRTISRCLEEGGRKLGDVELLAVGIGPGSFTGVRVGVATVKGLAFANGLPLIGVVSLTAMAGALSSGSGDGVLSPILHAHRGEVFAAVYRRSADGPVEIVPPFHALPADAASRIRAAAGDEKLVVVGDGYHRFESELAPALGAFDIGERDLDLPSAAAVGLEGRRRFAREGADDLAGLEPLYVRPSDAKLPAIPLEV